MSIDTIIGKSPGYKTFLESLAIFTFPEYPGMNFEKYESFDQIDKKRFMDMANDSFSVCEKKLIEGYTESASSDYILLAKEGEEYIGAIVAKTIPGTDIAYIDKFVVSNKYQGNGIGKKMMDIFLNQNKKSALRASKDSLANPFYEKFFGKPEKSLNWNLYNHGLLYDEKIISRTYSITLPKTVVPIKQEPDLYTTATQLAA